MSQKPSCLTSRRHFIKSSGITALSAPFVTSGLLADPPSERLRHASFGASGMAGADIGSLSRSKHFELAAVADVDLKRAEGIRKRFPKAKFYQDWRELLDKESKNFKVLQLSLFTGFFIGLYSLVDGYGARVSLSPIVYMSWSFILSAALFPIVLKIKNHKNIFQNVFNSGKKIFWIGGTLSYIIYTIVVWAFTKAPIPMVGALRESSIFFSIFIGYFFLEEKITPTKIFSILLILAGVIGLKLF